MEDLETTLCLDTGIIIDILRKKKETLLWLESIKREQPLAITLITVFEIYRGIYGGTRAIEELESFEYLKKQLTLLPFTETHMREAARASILLQRAGKEIDLRDLLIGICAREEGCILKTNNKKHFTSIPNLRILD